MSKPLNQPSLHVFYGFYFLHVDSPLLGFHSGFLQPDCYPPLVTHFLHLDSAPHLVYPDPHPRLGYSPIPQHLHPQKPFYLVWLLVGHSGGARHLFLVGRHSQYSSQYGLCSRHCKGHVGHQVWHLVIICEGRLDIPEDHGEFRNRKQGTFGKSLGSSMVILAQFLTTSCPLRMR